MIMPLGQRKDKKSFVIHYASQTLNDAQMNYVTTENELFALYKFESYQNGSPIVGHRPLCFKISDGKARY